MCNELNEYDLLRKRRIESQSLVRFRSHWLPTQSSPGRMPLD